MHTATRKPGRIIAIAVGAAALTLLVFLASCSAAPKSTVEITLESHAGTGYEWTSDVDRQDVFELVSTQTSDSADGDAVGGPLETTFTLKAAREGTATVTFTLSRPWESSDDNEYVTFQFTVDKDLNVTFDGSQGTHPQGNTASDLVTPKIS